MIRGKIIRSTGSWYTVKDTEGREIEARIKGKLRLNNIKNTNPVAVGDMVTLEMQPDQIYAITGIEPRKNYIIRKSINLSKQTHIIAANLDQAILIITQKEPFTPLGFIDRFLLTAEAYHIPVVIVFNKWDLYNEKDLPEAEALFDTYSKIGYQCIKFSIHQNKAEELKAILKDKTTLICGHSGVGKSSLINLVQPSLQLKTGSLSEYHQKGKHTTTFYELFTLDFGGEIIDSPGIKGFGVVEINRNEISHYFPEMRRALPLCKFNNCIHMDEPGCEVKKQVESGDIAFHRYKNYINIYYDRETDDEKEFK